MGIEPAFGTWLEQEITRVESRISGNKLKDLSQARLDYLLSLQRILNKKANSKDIGLHDAINDVLQQLAVMKENDTYLHRAKAD